MRSMESQILELRWTLWATWPSCSWHSSYPNIPSSSDPLFCIRVLGVGVALKTTSPHPTSRDIVEPCSAWLCSGLPRMLVPDAVKSCKDDDDRCVTLFLSSGPPHPTMSGPAGSRPGWPLPPSSISWPLGWGRKGGTLCPISDVTPGVSYQRLLLLSDSSWPVCSEISGKIYSFLQSYRFYRTEIGENLFLLYNRRSDTIDVCVFIVFDIFNLLNWVVTKIWTN